MGWHVVFGACVLEARAPSSICCRWQILSIIAFRCYGAFEVLPRPRKIAFALQADETMKMVFSAHLAVLDSNNPSHVKALLIGAFEPNLASEQGETRKRRRNFPFCYCCR